MGGILSKPVTLSTRIEKPWQAMRGHRQRQAGNGRHRGFRSGSCVVRRTAEASIRSQKFPDRCCATGTSKHLAGKSVV